MSNLRCKCDELLQQRAQRFGRRLPRRIWRGMISPPREIEYVYIRRRVFRDDPEFYAAPELVLGEFPPVGSVEGQTILAHLWPIAPGNTPDADALLRRLFD